MVMNPVTLVLIISKTVLFLICKSSSKNVDLCNSCCISNFFGFSNVRNIKLINIGLNAHFKWVNRCLSNYNLMFSPVWPIE